MPPLPDQIQQRPGHPLVWSAEGFDPSSEIVGALQGVLFTDQSPLDREQLRRRLSLTEIINPGFLKNYPPEEEELAYILIDPDIEYLIFHEKIDYNDGIAEIYQELEPSWSNTLRRSAMREAGVTKRPELPSSTGFPDTRSTASSIANSSSS